MSWQLRQRECPFLFVCSGKDDRSAFDGSDVVALINTLADSYVVTSAAIRSKERN